ncbi:hypothetical protein IscW_ISCW009934, partial [Ixodes scapularis]
TNRTPRRCHHIRSASSLSLRPASLSASGCAASTLALAATPCSQWHSTDDNKQLYKLAQRNVEEPIERRYVCNKAAGNALICATIFFSGADAATTMRLLRSINIPTVLDRLYFNYQKVYLLSAVKQVYEQRNTKLSKALRGKAIDLAGDGRCDEPGFSAKYCTYNFHEATTKKIIHVEQVQSDEVSSSNAIGNVAFVRGFNKLKDQGFTISSFMS